MVLRATKPMFLKEYLYVLGVDNYLPTLVVQAVKQASKCLRLNYGMNNKQCALSVVSLRKT